MADRTGQQLDNYRLTQLLGRGAFGEVYLGEHIYRKTQVAIKTLSMRLSNDEFYDFINEARIFRLQHPNIVSVLDFGIERALGTPFIVMDYIPNGTLRQRHPRGTQVSLAGIVQYVKQIAAALQYAHEENLVHRDVKPENMLLDKNEHVLLSDFGIAVTSQTARYSDQSMQVLAGTPNYMAPEQFLGKPSRASDQYALAVVVYEWLSGRCPFSGTFYELFGQHMQTAPPPLPATIVQYPQELEQIVMKALAKKPGDRFASVWEFALTLEGLYQKSLVLYQAPTIYAKAKEHYLQEGDTLYNEQRYAEAIAAYTLAISLDPTYALAYNNRGLAYRNLREYQKAIADYDRIIALVSDNALVYNNRGYAYFLLKDYQKAIADFDSALALDPNYAIAYNNRGNAYCILGAFARAIADYDRTLALDPNYATAYYNRGNAYDELGEYQKAIADYDRAIALAPNYTNAYNNRGYVYRNLGEYQKAIADYNRVIEIDPGNTNAHKGRGLAYSKLQDYSKAIADFDHALALDPNDLSVRNNKADVLRQLQERKEGN